MIDIHELLVEKIENMALPDPELWTYYKNLENRTIWIDTDIAAHCLEYIKYIVQWNIEDKGIPVSERKPIKLILYSYGGDLDVNNALVDFIKMSTTPVYGFNAGVACSAGAYIFLSCHKRYMMPNSYFLLHEGGADNFSGTFRQVVSQIEDYKIKISGLTEYVKEQTKIPEDVLKEQISGEWYIYAEDAIEYGIVDGIITNLDMMG